MFINLIFALAIYQLYLIYISSIFQPKYQLHIGLMALLSQLYIRFVLACPDMYYIYIGSYLICALFLPQLFLLSTHQLHPCPFIFCFHYSYLNCIIAQAHMYFSHTEALTQLYVSFILFRYQLYISLYYIFIVLYLIVILGLSQLYVISILYLYNLFQFYLSLISTIYLHGLTYCLALKYRLDSY